MRSTILRLCWKEFRQGWGLLACGVGVSLLAVPYVQMLRAQTETAWWVVMPFVVLVLLMAAVSINAALRARDSRERRSYAAAHFPLPPAWESAVGFKMHGLIALCIGLAYALALTRGGDFTDDFFLLYLLAALYFVGNFAIAFVVSAAFSPWAGMAAGIAWTVGNYQTLGMLGSGISLVVDDTELLQLAISLLAAAAGFLLLAGPARLAFARRRAAITLLLAAGAIGYPIYRYAAGVLPDGYHTDKLPRLASADGALAVECPVRHAVTDPRFALTFADYRHGRSATRAFPRAVKPVGFRGDAAILASQLPGERQVTVLEWRLRDNGTTPLCAFPARRGELARLVEAEQASHGAFFGTVSPDGRWGLVSMPARYAQAVDNRRDLWRIDFRQQTARLIGCNLPLEAGQGEANWTGNRAVIAGVNPVEVSPEDGAIRSLQLRWMKGERP